MQYCLTLILFIFKRSTYILISPSVETVDYFEVSYIICSGKRGRKEEDSRKCQRGSTEETRRSDGCKAFRGTENAGICITNYTILFMTCIFKYY